MTAAMQGRPNAANTNHATVVCINGHIKYHMTIQTIRSYYHCHCIPNSTAHDSDCPARHPAFATKQSIQIQVILNITPFTPIVRGLPEFPPIMSVDVNNRKH